MTLKELFQSTLPRGERPPQHGPGIVGFHVSIHAPARGATQAARRGRAQKHVSIHAPARGATP